MRKRRFAVFLLVFVSFGLMCAVPAEDFPETAYDESAGVPYQSSTPTTITANDSCCDLRFVFAATSSRTTPSPRVRSQRASSSTTPKPAARALLCSLRC